MNSTKLPSIKLSAAIALLGLAAAPALVSAQASVIADLTQEASVSVPLEVSIASCISSKEEGGALYAMGRESALKGEMDLSSKAASACMRGAGKPVLSASYRERVGEELMLVSTDFRKGLYSASVGEGYSDEQQVATGELGVVLEQYKQARAGAVRCLQAPEDLISMMEEADLPFAIAVAGKRIGVDAEADAESLAKMLISKSQAVFEQIEVTHCIGARDTEFRDYAKHLDMFMGGVHPWALGCTVGVDGVGATLKCV